jgi:hypothetical protein
LTRWHGKEDYLESGGAMKNFVLAAVAVLMFAVGFAVAGEVHDWQDLEAVRGHVHEAISEMERAQAANHYDMGGHASKAEKFLHDAEKELHEAIEARKKAH